MEDTSPRPLIVGSGLIAKAHVAALAEMGVRPAGVFSPTRAHAEEAAKLWGCEVAADLRELLSTPGATHVHVCSPPVQHEEAVLPALAEGLEILCEKPLAPSAVSAAAMASAAVSSAARGYLLFNLRFNEGVRRCRQIVLSGEIGRPVTVQASYLQQWNASPSSNDWRLDPSYVGPSRVVTEIGSHLIDLISYVLDERFSTVSAFSARMGERDFETASDRGVVTPSNEDAFAAHFRTGEGVLGELFASEISHGANNAIELRIDGTRKSVTWSSADPSRVTLSHKSEGTKTYGTGAPRGSVAAQIEAIYRSYDEAADVASFEDGLSNAQVMDAIRASDAAGAWCEVAGSPGGEQLTSG